MTRRRTAWWSVFVAPSTEAFLKT
ncbi:MAG: hypothetical protein JWO63_1246, partial [Frankiales bacterium]|nr:hypothetical protein [Frankiales bacterium]